MPIDRDDQTERDARIDQMIEDARSKAHTLTEDAEALNARAQQAERDAKRVVESITHRRRTRR